MNPANFSNMGMQAMGPQGIPQQGVPQRPPGQSHPAQARIFHLIQLHQQQFPIHGWQTTLQIQQRAHNAFQIFSQVRLIKNDMSQDNAIQVAVQFEQKTFQESSDRTDYDQKCRSKMEDIARTRNQLASKMQQQLQNSQHPQANMAQQQMQMQGFQNLNQQQQMQQMQQRLMQQQQQNQIQGMGMQPQAQMQMGNQHGRIQGMPPNMPQVMPNQPQSKYTPQEQLEIQRKIQELYSTASRNSEHMTQLSSVLQQNHPNQSLRDLMQRYFQNQALRWFEETKKMPAGQRPNQMMPGGPVPQQGRPISQEPGRPPNQQPTPVSAPQPFDPSYMGSVDQMRLNALRSQEAGQVVVPASQAVSQPQRAVGGATQVNPQTAANRGVQTPQVPQQPSQMWNQQNGQPPQQTNSFNGMNGVPQSMLQGQSGGLNSGPRTPQPNMPHLNRAFGPQPNVPPQQGTPQMGQQNQMNPQQFLQNGVLGLPPGITQQQFQQRVQQMPEADRRKILMVMKQRQNAQTTQMQTQRSQQGQPIPAGPQPVQNQQPTPRNTQINGPPQQPVVGRPQPNPSQTQPQRTDLQTKNHRAAQLANSSMTTEQEQEMDMHPYPTGILNATTALSQLPTGMRTWGQLKQWVKMNSASLPAGSEQKLRGLQGLHYQSLQNPKKGAPPPAQRNAAPPAQMTPMPNNNQIPQPSPQEIANLRGKHPQLAGLNDDQIRDMVMKQRTLESNKRRQGQLQMLQQQQQQQQAAQNQAQSQPQPQAVPVGQLQQQQPSTPQQTPMMSGPAKFQQATTAQAAVQSSATHKGVKRPSSDDVVEVPNPNINQQRHQTKQQPRAPAAPMVPIPPKPTETQKSQAMQREKSNGQPTQAPTQDQPKTAEAIRSEERFKTILAEARKATPQRQPVPMDADTRRRMLTKLADARDLITRMGPFLPMFYKVFNDDDALRNLARVYLTLAQQYKNEQVKLASPVEHFTVSLGDLDTNIRTLRSYFETTMQRMNEEKAMKQKAADSAKESTLALSAANLQQHQNNMKIQREQSMKKESNRAPPAPTSAQAPPWGPSSPHGVPAVSLPSPFTQDKLQLPVKKKLKKMESPAPTPAPITGTSIGAASPLLPKSLEIQRTPAPVMLKCPVQNCSDNKGFPSQAELDKHMVEHETKEPIIDNPTLFALEQMQHALNLDKNGKAKPKPEVDLAEAPAMKQSTSSQGIKQESATPMSRAPTGPSPASQLKTLQPAKTQRPSSNVLPDVILPDPWADSFIRPEMIQEAFSPLSTLSGPKTWTKIRDHLTPESNSDSSDPSKSSPRLSDVSENDAVKITMDTGLSKSWIPVDWMDADLRAGMDEFEFLDLNVDVGPADPMDWETLFGETEEQAQARVDKERNRVEKDIERGGTGVASDFARIYGAGEMEPRRR